MMPRRTEDCRVCGRRIRPMGTTVQDHPGTLSSGTKGLCQKDYEAHKRARRDEAEASVERELTSDESKVLAMVNRRCAGEARERVASVLGLL